MSKAPVVHSWFDYATGERVLTAPVDLAWRDFILHIPAGFRWDRASVPKAGRSLIDKDDCGEAGPLGHDFLYRCGGVPPLGQITPADRVVSRAEADRLFYDVMGLEGRALWVRTWAYALVRAGGVSAWRGLALIVLVLLTACGGGSSFPPPPAPAPQPAPVVQPVPPVVPTIPLGLNSHSLDADRLAQLRELGVTRVRYTLYAAWWLQDDAFRERFTTEVAAATARGIEVLCVVHQMPNGWGPQEFAAWVGERVRETPGCRAVQVGNEVPFDSTVEAHAVWHEAAYRAIKEADSTVTVVTYAANALGEDQLVRFMATNPTADAIAIHVYGWPLSGMLERTDLLTRGRVRWVTEFGLSPEVLPDWWVGDWETEQRDQWSGVVELGARLGFDRMYGYSLFTEEPRERHGIVRPDGTLRPAAEWLQSVLREDR